MSAGRAVVGAVAVVLLGAASLQAREQGDAAPGAIHLFNARRTGYTPRPLPPPYRLAWTHGMRHKPRPAWREPAWETQRIDLDYAYPVSAGNGLVYVASSSDHAVHALDLATGEARWRRFTQGPVRLAPAVDGGRVYASSDDGSVYCLDGRSGRVVWTYRPSVPDERLIGNEQMVSRWPARAGVLVHGGRAYTAFGMWSAEGVVVACLDAAKGSVVWQNDTSGTRYMTQPHYEAMAGVSPQGYLALCGDVLVVPCGRAMPAFFDTGTGRLLYDESEGLFPGGAWTMTFRDLAFTPCELLQKPNPVAPAGPEADVSPNACLVAVRARTGEEVFHLRGVLQGVVSDSGTLSLIGPRKLVSLSLADVLAAAAGGQARLGSSEGQFVEAAKHKRWETPTARVYELIQAGPTLIAGGRGTLACYNAENGRKTWETKLRGDVRELLVAGDALLVSTTEGEIHCYRPGKGGAPHVVRPAARSLSVPPATAERAKALLAAGGVAEGYAIALGNADAATLAALARQAQLTWYWAAGARDAGALRAELADAGLYGTRVAIHNVAGNPLPYADYVANLVVFRVGAAADLAGTPAAEVYRVLRPCGGVAVIACSAALRPAVERWLEAGGIPQAGRRRVAPGFRIERGPLPGAGAWTHQYADPGKSGASRDQRVRLPLKVLWFGSVGPADIVSRHYRAPVPIALDGRLFVPGMNYVHAVDAYNGRILWERKLPGVGRWPAAYRGGCIAVDEAGVYALQGTTCLRLDPATGTTLFAYKPPPRAEAAAKQPGAQKEAVIWEYLAVTDDAVVGTLGKPNVQRSWWSRAYPANRLLFALDKATGKPRWTCEPASAIDSSAVAIAGERLFLIDGLAELELLSNPRRRPKAKPRTLYRSPPSAHPRVLKALALASGKELWQTREVGPGQNSLWVAGGVVLATIPISTGTRLKRRGPAVSAFSAQDGSLLWTRQGGGGEPVVVGGTVYLPDAFDLRTGKPVRRSDPVTGERVPFVVARGGGCGRFAGCPTLLMKRSGSLGFIDLRQRSGIYHYPNTRASCWISMIPACGLVLVPEGSSSCPCAYNYKTSLALAPASRHNHWGLYGGAPRAKNARVKHLRLNFGAPGDKPDNDGTIWFAFPRPSTTGPRGGGGMGRQPIDKLPVELLSAPTATTTVARNPDWASVEGTETPWLYACALAGPLRLRLGLAPAGSARRRYQVTLLFCAPARAGRFDVKLQGKTALANLDVAREAGGTNRPLTRELTVEAGDSMTLELVPRDGGQPALSGLAVVAQ